MQMQATDMKIERLALSVIHADQEFNCRMDNISPNDVRELMKDMSDNGLLQPIAVRETKEPGYQYEVVAGFRRFMSATYLRWDGIDCVIHSDMTDDRARAFNISENVNRKQLTLLEEANAVKYLKLRGETQHEAARIIGQTRAWIQVRWKLLELHPEIQQAAMSGIITQNDIKSLSHMNIDMQLDQVRKISRQRDKANREGGYIPSIIKDKANTKAKKRRSVIEIHALQTEIRELIGNSITTKVLGWAAGKVSTEEVLAELQSEAKTIYDIDYIIPANGLADRIDPPELRDQL